MTGLLHRHRANSSASPARRKDWFWPLLMVLGLLWQDCRAAPGASNVASSAAGTAQPATALPATAQPDVNRPVSAYDGIFGLRPGMSRAQLTELWGKPMAEFRLNSAQSVLAFASDLWVVAGREVDQIMLGGDWLTMTGQQLMGSGPDLRQWRGAQGLGADLRINWPGRAGWQRAGRGLWLAQSGHTRLLLQLHSDKPAMLWMVDAHALRLTHAPLPALFAQLRSAPTEPLLNWLAQWKIYRLHRGEAPLPLPEAFQLHQLYCSCDGHWMLPEAQIHVRRTAQGQQLRLSKPLFSTAPDLLAGYLQALQLPGSKAGYIQLFADLQDAGARIEVHRSGYSLIVDFASEAANATVEQVEIRVRQHSQGHFVNVGLQ